MFANVVKPTLRGTGARAKNTDDNAIRDKSNTAGPGELPSGGRLLAQMKTTNSAVFFFF